VQKVEIRLVDDLDQSDADETVAFALDGSTYEIDLNKKNAEKLRKALAPFLDSARRTSAAKKKTSKASSNGVTPKEIRAWAAQNGYEVPERGRIPAEVSEAYHAAN
jgi:hypothetical protein